MSTPHRKFDSADVARWEDAYGEQLSLLREQVELGRVRSGYQIAQLSRVYELLGLTAIAAGDFGRALGRFAAGANAWTALLTMAAEGQEIAAELLQRPAPFHLAFGSGAPRVAEDLAASLELCEHRRKRTPETSTTVMCRIVREDIVAARQLLRGHAGASTWPAAAVVEHDETSFIEHMRDFAELWRERIRTERLQKFPDAVCDHIELGWIRLAEKIWGKRPDVDLRLGNIPPAIFEVTPERIDPGV